MTQKEFDENKAYLDGVNLTFLANAWDNEPFSAELESYTDSGGDMIVNLEVLDKEHLQDYIDNFDINDEVILWWRDDTQGTRLPFSNIKQHYEDLEEWLDELQEICDDMPH